MAKKRTKQKKYSVDFKLNVIMDMREHRLSYHETVRRHWEIPKEKEPNYINTVKRWERIFLEEGAEGLMKERRGKNCVSNGIKRGRPPKLNKTIEEDLIAENQRLRMEIEYLKKLDALVQKRLQEEKKKLQSSMN